MVTPVSRHPTTCSWDIPPVLRPDPATGTARTNLRELAARRHRFEHHLMVVARLGPAQLEIATASEPLYFAHQNISDEYALAMLTGDAMLDAFPMRTFLSDPADGHDVARLNHSAGDLLLHSYGWSHWPGRLRPPFTPIDFPPGERRAVYTLVYCASRPLPPGDRPLGTTPGREADAKRYDDSGVPLLLRDTKREPSGVLAVIGDTRAELLVDAERVAPARGGWLVVLDAAEDSEHFAGDLWRIDEGATLETRGVRRALLVHSDAHAPEPVPESWAHVPVPPFAVFEEASRGTLPLDADGFSVAALDGATVRVTVGAHSAVVPRYWLARFLFRVALHGYAVGYLETYGGFFHDDRGPRPRFGLRVAGPRDEWPYLELNSAAYATLIERLYRAVAPDGYVERIG